MDKPAGCGRCRCEFPCAYMAGPDYLDGPELELDEREAARIEWEDEEAERFAALDQFEASPERGGGGVIFRPVGE